MFDFVFRMLDFAAPRASDGAWRVAAEATEPRGEFCIKDDGFCIKHDGFCIKDDGFCIKTDGVCI